MIMQDKKRPAASLIIDMMKKPNMKAPMLEEVPTNEMGDEVSGDDALDAASKSLLSAIETKDSKAIKSSMRSLVQLLMQEEESAETED